MMRKVLFARAVASIALPYPAVPEPTERDVAARTEIRAIKTMTAVKGFLRTTFRLR